MGTNLGEPPYSRRDKALLLAPSEFKKKLDKKINNLHENLRPPDP